MKIQHFVIFFSFCFFSISSSSQLKWMKVDSLFQPLPSSVHVYRTIDQLDGKPNIAYYVEANLKDKKLDFTADTTYSRRLKPAAFYERNNKALLVVNCTFFSFESNRNLNIVMKDGDVIAYNANKFRKSRADSNIRVPVYGSAIGITKNRKADIAWIWPDSTKKMVKAMQVPEYKRINTRRTNRTTGQSTTTSSPDPFQSWKMRTAVGGGPVLLQNGEIMISNEEEMMFAGKAINDKHPRTAMGYTKSEKLIILVIQGRAPGIAEGATLKQEAQMLKELGCWEALNLDGGGSSCMLVNGKETIKVSDAGGQRPVPAVFIIKKKELVSFSMIQPTV